MAELVRDENENSSWSISGASSLSGADRSGINFSELLFSIHWTSKQFFFQ